MNELNRLFPLARRENQERLKLITHLTHSRLAAAEREHLWGSLQLSCPIQDGSAVGVVTDASTTKHKDPAA